MEHKKRIAFVTGSRADYGIMRRYLGLLDQDENVDLVILATGALLDGTYGRQVVLIYKDRFRVEAEIELGLDPSSNAGVLSSMADALEKFGTYFEENRYHMLIILGDRYEMLSVATAAAMQRIPILHIHGGEATFGNYDEFIRHCISKMSRYHFTSTEIYRRRVIQLGEPPENVFNLGALGAENCLYIDERNVPRQIKDMEVKNYFVVLFHPETLTNIDVSEQMRELLAAADRFKDQQFIFLGSNADTHSELIRGAVRDYVRNHNNAFYFENLHSDAYHYLLKNAICLVGNSSSGIIEAPSLGVCTVNIGDRQKGRVRGESVLDVMCIRSDIEQAMRRVMDMSGHIKLENPYYQENSAEKYYRTTIQLLDRIARGETEEPKTFFDLC